MKREQLTMAEAVESSGCSRSTLMHYEALGIVKPRRVGPQRTRLFQAEDVVAARKYRQQRKPT